MIRVLQVVNDMHRAGLETMLMNYYRNIDRNQIQFDFLTHRPNKSDYDDEIITLGGKVYYAPRLYPQNYPKYFRWMKAFFAEHPEYKIIHSHIDAMSYLPLKAAKKAGISVRIAHSHSTSIDRDWKYLLKLYFRKCINSVATNRLACGREAGEFLFGEAHFDIIPNAVEADKFYFNEETRINTRTNLNLNDKFVVGHVGRFCYPKNHKFLIEIFNEVQKKNPASVLLLVGVGEKLTEIQDFVNKLGLSDKVLFLGNRSDVNELYQIMDVFVLPSLFEGVPVVGVEAQFADLPCLFSDKTPTEVKFNIRTKFIGLDSSPEFWADEILATRNGEPRSSTREDIVNSRYDIKCAHTILEEYYKEQLKTKSGEEIVDADIKRQLKE